MKVEVHLLCFQEREILPYALRHWKTFASRIVVHDLGSTDGCQQIASEFCVDLKQWDCKGEFDDRLNKKIKNEAWLGTDADWVACVDADELIYFPSGAEFTLETYAGQGVEIIKPHGYEMMSDVFPTGSGQIYDEVKHGTREVLWYSKPGMFNAKRVESLDFGTGAHVVTATMKDGRRVYVDNKTPPCSPSTYFLHFHHIGGLDRITKRYAENQARQSAMNKQMNWGNREPPRKHAEDKRRMILARLERVLP